MPDREHSRGIMPIDLTIYPFWWSQFTCIGKAIQGKSTVSCKLKFYWKQRAYSINDKVKINLITSTLIGHSYLRHSSLSSFWTSLST